MKLLTLSEENKLDFLGYKPMIERRLDLLNYLKNSKNDKLSNFLHCEVYNCLTGPTQDLERYGGYVSDLYSKTFENGYSINAISKYIAKIPLKNQEEIAEICKTLKENPLIKFYGVKIFAPTSHFVNTISIVDVDDPIAFAEIAIQNKLYHIVISQWD